MNCLLENLLIDMALCDWCQVLSYLYNGISLSIKPMKLLTLLRAVHCHVGLCGSFCNAASYVLHIDHLQISSVFYAMDACLLIFITFEFIFGIWISALCCGAVCRCCKKPNPASVSFLQKKLSKQLLVAACCALVFLHAPSIIGKPVYRYLVDSYVYAYSLERG